jgi:hypothetical protein
MGDTMWLMTKFGFFSIVRKDEGRFHIRSREKIDIENLVRLVPLPDAEIFESSNADYRFRVIVGSKELHAVLEFIGNELDYDNFKDCIDRTPGQSHKPYHEVWGVLADALGAYGSKGKNSQG